MNYYIQGNKEKADQIKTAFEQLGYDISWPEGCANPDVINIGVERNGAKYVVAETAAYIRDIIKTHPDYKELKLPVQPKFKVGDYIKTGNQIDTIAEIDNYTQRYYCESGRTISFVNQDLWKLYTKPHYDILNFYAGMPVLVRDSYEHKWLYTIFGNYDKHNSVYPFVVVDMRGYAQCIPFKGNEHLLGTTDMCDEQYINW